MQIYCGLAQLPHTSMVDCPLLVADKSKHTADMLWEEHATADRDSSHWFEREGFKTVKPLMKNYHFSEFSLHMFMSVNPWPTTMPLLRPLLRYFWQPQVECSCCKIYFAWTQWLFPHSGAGVDTLFHSLTVLFPHGGVGGDTLFHSLTVLFPHGGVEGDTLFHSLTVLFPHGGVGGDSFIHLLYCFHMGGGGGELSFIHWLYCGTLLVRPP